MLPPPTLEIPVRQAPKKCKLRFNNKKSVEQAIIRSIRYPEIIGQNWQTLSNSIQRRFIKNIPSREATIYQGRIHKTRLSVAGHVLSFLSNIIGAPMPKSTQERGPVIVIVREARAFNGQYWTRVFANKNKFPKIIQTIKRFAGPTGLEEMVTSFFGIALTIKTDRNNLSFISDHYFLSIGTRRLQLPSCLIPGTLIINHKETGPKRFRYTLSLTHPLLGEIFYQTAIFEEISP